MGPRRFGPGGFAEPVIGQEGWPRRRRVSKDAGRGRATIATSIRVTRLKRMIWLHHDVGVNLTGAAIIIDLLERLDRMETELRRLRGAP